MSSLLSINLNGLFSYAVNVLIWYNIREMWKSFAFFLLFTGLISVSVANTVAEDDAVKFKLVETIVADLSKSEPVPVDIEPDIVPLVNVPDVVALTEHDHDDSMISISLDGPEDVNWQGALEVNGSSTKEPVVVLPFLPSYPIDNVKVRLRILKKRF